MPARAAPSIGGRQDNGGVLRRGDCSAADSAPVAKDIASQLMRMFRLRLRRADGKGNRAEASQTRAYCWSILNDGSNGTRSFHRYTPDANRGAVANPSIRLTSLTTATSMQGLVRDSLPHGN